MSEIGPNPPLKSPGPEGFSFADLKVGMTVEEERVWTPEDLATFGRLAGDTAPIHYNPDFAKSAGFRGPLLFGFLVAAGFSRLLGCRLPGRFSVIHSIRMDFAAPVYPNEKVRYRCAIIQLSSATKSAVLDISATRADGTKVLRGKAQCGMLK
jgi:acyl dehydratase